MSDTNTDTQRDLSQNLPHDTPTVSHECSNISINANINSTNQRALIYFFGFNSQGYSNEYHCHANPPEQLHLTVPDPSNNVRNIKRQPYQERAHLALDDCTRHRLPSGLACSALDQEDWSFGSENPPDFSPLAVA